MNQENKVNLVYLILPPLIIAAIIFYLSCLIEPSNLPEVTWNFPLGIDKLVHFCMYFGLAFVTGTTYVLLKNGKIIFLRLLFFAFLLPVIYGGIIELLQGQYFNRSAEWGDFFANTIGAFVGVIFTLLIRAFIIKRNRKKQYQI